MSSIIPTSVLAHLKTRYTHCPLCEGNAEPYLANTCDLHYGIEGRWDYDRCSICEVVFLNPAPTEQFLSSVYDDSYYSYQQFKLSSTWKTLICTVLCYNPGITGDPKFSKPGRILDIGCGSGEFLFKMKMKGWETHGVELSAKAAELGNRTHALNIQSGSLLSAKLSDGYFDYIRLNHSFEHLPNPDETLSLIYRYLAPGGLVFIGVPNVNGLQAKLFGKYWWNLGPPVHPLNYSKKTLVRLLTKHGFDVVRYRTNSNFAGILGSLQMAINDRRGIRSDTGRLITLAPAKLLAQWMSKIIDIFAAGDCLEITASKRLIK